MTMALYFGVGLAWCYYTYWCVRPGHRHLSCHACAAAPVLLLVSQCACSLLSRRCFGSQLFKPGEIPALRDCFEQVGPLWSWRLL